MIVSNYENAGRVRFPAFSGSRVLMMPIWLDDIRGSLPDHLKQWSDTVYAMRGEAEGLAYLTIDEREIIRGQRHRRPGLHVDGWHDDSLQGTGGAWGGGGGAWSESGMVMASSHEGCAAWRQVVTGDPKKWGDCDHLRDQLDPERREVLKPFHMYRMGSLSLHETLPMEQSGKRQFVRLSLPSLAEWPSSCTPNPKGIKPIHIGAARPTEFTNYTPH